jgi:hypothetical protein
VAGAFDIQRFPKGLLDFLGLKATGDTPHTLEGSVRGQINLDRYYLVDRVVAIQPSVTITANGFFTAAVATVPPGEMWLPLGLRISATFAALTSMQWCPSTRRALGGGQMMLTNFISAIASVTNECTYTWGELVPFMPGDAFGVYAQQTVLGANPSASILMEYYKLSI